MSRKFLNVLSCLSVVFGPPVVAGPASNPGYFSRPAANDNAKPGEPAPVGNVEKPSAPAQGGGEASGDICNARLENSQSTCNAYLNPPRSAGQSQSPQAGGSTTETLHQIDRGVENGLAESRRRSRACVTAASQCVEMCGSNQVNRDKCQQLSQAAKKKHENNQHAAREDLRNNEELRDRVASQRPPEGAGGSALPNLPAGSGGTRETSAPPASTASNFNTQATTAGASAPAHSVKTPEQAKQERRERRREESRQERIDALGKAFMNLNPQQPLGQAIQERSSSPSEQRAQKAAAKAAAATGPVAADNSPKEDGEEIGRAGFNKLAEKNLAARKKLAASLGVNASNLPAASLTRRQAAAGNGGGGGNVFGGTNGFSHSGDGASLDPVVKVEPPSDIPQNFRLEAPSAGGGGSGGSSRRMYGSMFTNSQNPDYSPRARGPAGLEETEPPQEIRRRNADIWNVISVSFRRHCALGRLMDCADHLPK